MAGDATHIVPRMLRGDGVHVLRAAGVAGEAARVDFFGGSGLELKDFRFVAAAVDVGLACTMASLAAFPLRTLLVIERGDKVARSLEVFDKTLAGHVLVTGLAGLFADVFGLRIRWRWGGSRRGVRSRADDWRGGGRRGLVWNLSGRLT